MKEFHDYSFSPKKFTKPFILFSELSCFGKLDDEGG